MRNSEPVMPSIPFHIVIRKNICLLLFSNVNESSIFEPRLKKLSFVIPDVLVELGSLVKIIMNITSIKQPSHLTDSEVIETKLQCLTTCALPLIILTNIPQSQVLFRVGP